MSKFFRKTGRKTNRKGAKKSMGKKVVGKTFRQKVLSVVRKDAEKKHISYSNASSPLTVGQVDGLNAQGFFMLDMTPVVSQNAGVSGRVGADIDVVSANLRFQFYQMSATYQNVKLKYHLVYIPRNCENSLSLIQTQMFQNNGFNGIIDYNSPRNPDYMGTYKILRTGYVNLPTDPASVTTQTTIKETRMGFKFKKPLTVKYSANTNSIAQGRFLLIVFADSGNKNGTTASTLNVPVKEVNTGVNFNYMIDYYYTDI